MDERIGAQPHDNLTIQEVRAAIEALSALDRQRLLLVERRYRAATDFAAGDLLQTVLCQAFLQERRCPRDVGFASAIAAMMRSVGGHRRETLKRQVSFDAPAIPTRNGGTLTPADTLRSADLDPEAAVIEKERPDVVATALRLFDGDEDIQYVILGIADGLKGAPLQSATGLSSNQVHYALRKIRNRLGSDPEGWLA